MIYFSVTGQMLKVVGNPHVVADTVNHIACDIRFSGGMDRVACVCEIYRAGRAYHRSRDR